MIALHAVELTRTRGECVALAYEVQTHTVHFEGSDEPATFAEWQGGSPVGSGRDDESGLIACIAALDDACRARRLIPNRGGLTCSK